MRKKVRCCNQRIKTILCGTINYVRSHLKRSTLVKVCARTDLAWVSSSDGLLCCVFLGHPGRPHSSVTTSDGMTLRINALLVSFGVECMSGPNFFGPVEFSKNSIVTGQDWCPEMLPMAKYFLFLWRGLWFSWSSHSIIHWYQVIYCYGWATIKIVLGEWVSSNKIMTSFEKVKTNISHAFEWKILSWKGKI